MNAIPYDFTKPVRMAADWQNRLTGWYQSASALANRTWAKQLSTPIEVSLGALDVTYAQQGLGKLPTTVIGYRVVIAAGRLPTLLVFPRILLLQLVGVLLGDDVSATTDREMTLVEENLADYFLVQLWLPFFRESWPGAKVVPWELQEREANPQSSRFFSADEVLLTLPWQMRGPWGVAEGLWFFQKKGILETLADEKDPSQGPIDEKTATQRKHALVTSLPVRVDFVLGTTELKLSQLASLQVGDVVLLDQRHDEGISASAGSQKLFGGRVGRIGSWKAFRVESSSRTNV
jgi:flagellar motor switch protein FliM